MAKLTRREVAIGAAALGLSPIARAHEGLGAWSPLSPMPFAVQEIYPAPFWKAPDASLNLKPKPFNIIVNAGGLTPDADFNVTDAVTFYDPMLDAWDYASPLPAPRHHVALVNNNGFLYGIGGFARDARGGWQMRQNCWRLGGLHEPWEEMRPMPVPQAEVACASVNGHIHVAGGRSPAGSRNAEWSDHIDTDQHWFYNAAADDWYSLAPLPTARNSGAAAVVNGVLFVIGGRTVRDGNVAAVELYDPVTDRWSSARPMPQAQAGLAAAVSRGKIYVFGGEYFQPSPGGVYPEAWEYDPQTDKWRAVAAMPRPRHGLGAVSIDNTIYVLGGAAKAGGNETSTALDKFEI